MSTAYNRECRFKVEWEDLAHSLQARFRNIENDLINVHNSINTINKNIGKALTGLNLAVE